MSTAGDFGNPLRKFKLVFLGEQSGRCLFIYHIRVFLGSSYNISKLLNFIVVVCASRYFSLIFLQIPPSAL